MGGGRARKEDPIDPGVGIRLLATEGMPVRAGEVVALLRTRRGGEPPAAAVGAAIEIRDRALPVTPLLLEEFTP
jgi:thymidine phosphorylase